MPVIPTLKESQRISQGGVGPFQDTSGARAAGENLQLLGRSIASASRLLKEDKKTDTFARSQWVKQAEANAEMEKNKFMSARLETNKYDDGSGYEEDFKKTMSDSKSKFQDTVPEEYRAYTGISYDTAEMKNTADVLKEVVVKRQKFKLNAFGETTNAEINQIEADPSKVEKYRQSLHDSIQMATDSGILSPEKLRDNISGVNKKIADAEINGWTKAPQNSSDVPLFENAAKALEKNKGLYSPEEYAKKSEGIRDAKYKFINDTYSIEKRGEENRRKANEERQNASVDFSYQQLIEHRNDPVKVAVLKKTFVDQMKDGKFRYVMPQAFKALKQADDLQDGAMSYEIARDLGPKPTNKEINEMRDRIRYNVADDKMGVEKGEYWLKRLDLLKEGNKKDPNYAVKVQAIYSYIRATHKIGKLDDMTNLNSEDVRAANLAMHNAQVLLGKNIAPEIVLNKLKAQWTELKQASGNPVNFPESPYTNTVLDNEEAFREEKEMLLDMYDRGVIGTDKYKKGMQNVKRLEDQHKANKTLIENRVEQLGNDPLIQTKQPQTPFRR